MRLKHIVEDLVKKFGTACPFELASCLNIIIIEWNLNEEIRGYYKYHKRNRYIVINSNLNDKWKRVVCAHELWHAVLHPRINTLFMRKYTLLSVDKIEREANIAAAHLLIPDDSLQKCISEQMTIYEIASLHSVPLELVELKCKGLF